MQATFFGALSPKRRQLVELMQRTNFGRIENLRVSGGEPQCDATTRVITEWKLGAPENGVRPEARLSDFALKAPIVELFEMLTQLRDDAIVTIEVRYGLPFRVLIAGSAHVTP